MAKRNLGLLAGVAIGACYTGALGVPMTASERRLGRYLRAEEGHAEAGAGGGSGGGGATALLDDDPAAGEGTPAPTPAPSPTPSPTPAPTLDWATGVSAEKAEGEELSNLEWLQKRGYKDLDGLVKSARDTQRAVLESGKVKIPGADAKPEELKAFREAIGAPETIDGYAVDMPEVDGAEFPLELDSEFIGPMKEIAHKHNLPAAAFKELGDAFVASQLEALKQEVKQADDDRDAKVKEWGAKAAANKMDFRRGAELIGWDKQTIAALQRGGNTGAIMDGLVKLGQLAGEDFFAGADGSKKFGVGSLEEANKALDEFNTEPGIYEKLKSKDPSTVARYDRLTGAVAHFKALAAKK